MAKNSHDILEQWIQAVNKADVEGLLSLYHHSAVLIPTFSTGVLNSAEELRGYFEKLGSRAGLSVSLDEKSLIIQEQKNQFSTLGGLYSWRFEVGGEFKDFEARFTYVMDLSQANPIMHHHSSQVPSPL